jgi:hypothetical protein
MAYKGVLTPEEAERLGVARSSTVIFSPSPKLSEKLRQVKNQPSPNGQTKSQRGSNPSEKN